MYKRALSYYIYCMADFQSNISNIDIADFPSDTDIAALLKEQKQHALKKVLTLQSELLNHYKELLSLVHMDMLKSHSADDKVGYASRLRSFMELQSHITCMEAHSTSIIEEFHRMSKSGKADQSYAMKGFPKD